MEDNCNSSEKSDHSRSLSRSEHKKRRHNRSSSTKKRKTKHRKRSDEASNKYSSRREDKRHRSGSSRRHRDSSESLSLHDSSGRHMDGNMHNREGLQHTIKEIHWENDVLLLGKKIDNVKFHLCFQCGKPILYYARMMPCKHVYCSSCGKELLDQHCLLCSRKAIDLTTFHFTALRVCEYKMGSDKNVPCFRGYENFDDYRRHCTERHGRSLEEVMADDDGMEHAASTGGAGGGINSCSLPNVTSLGNLPATLSNTGNMLGLTSLVGCNNKMDGMARFIPNAHPHSIGPNINRLGSSDCTPFYSGGSVFLNAPNLHRNCKNSLLPN